MKYIRDNKLGIFGAVIGFITFMVAAQIENIIGLIIGGGCLYLGIDRICKRGDK